MPIDAASWSDSSTPSQAAATGASALLASRRSISVSGRSPWDPASSCGVEADSPDAEPVPLRNRSRMARTSRVCKTSFNDREAFASACDACGNAFPTVSGSTTAIVSSEPSVHKNSPHRSHSPSVRSIANRSWAASFRAWEKRVDNAWHTAISSGWSRRDANASRGAGGLGSSTASRGCRPGIRPSPSASRARLVALGMGGGESGNSVRNSSSFSSCSDGMAPSLCANARERSTAITNGRGRRRSR